VKGRIQIEDTVIEKVASLASVEVPGVAGFGGGATAGFQAAGERHGPGHERASREVHARIEDRHVWLHLVIVVEYGAVVMDVANAVKANVARMVDHMLGMAVVEVNVTVHDVEMPALRTAATD